MTTAKTTILTWNIQFGRGVDDRIDLSRIRDHILAMADPDVICLQEVSVGFELADGADQAAQLAQLFPDYRAVVPPALEWIDGERVRRFGNAILSRLPVLETLSHPLPRPADDRFPTMQRQVIEAIVATPGGALRIATTHLEYYSIAQRRAQVQRLRELEGQWAGALLKPAPAKGNDTYAARPAPIGTVLCGDFNFPLTEDSYQVIQQPLGDGELIDAWSVVGQGQPHPPTCGIFDLKQWPDGGHARDFFFVSAGLRDRVVDLVTNVTTDASDHQPLLLTLR